jgi:hypothetical protein
MKEVLLVVFKVRQGRKITQNTLYFAILRQETQYVSKYFKMFVGFALVIS